MALPSHNKLLVLIVTDFEQDASLLTGLEWMLKLRCRIKARNSVVGLATRGEVRFTAEVIPYQKVER